MTEVVRQELPSSVDGGKQPLLDIRGLRVDFPDVPGSPAIDGMDLDVGRGEIVGLVGESGSGKSLTALTVMGLLPPGGRVCGGTEPELHTCGEHDHHSRCYASREHAEAG